jgi:hypothetical protein
VPRRFQAAFGVLIAVVLVATSAFPAAAAFWHAPTQVSGSSRAFALPGAMARTSHGVTGVVYAEQTLGLAYRIFFRRSTDGGATWQAPVPLSSATVQASDPSITADGTSFHVVWTQIGSGDPVLRYARGDAGGTSWGAKKALTGTTGPHTPRISAMNGRVAVVWAISPSSVYARVSTDSGSTFGPRRTVTTTISGAHATLPVIGISQNERIHVAYNDGGAVWHQRSLNDGVGWSAPTRLAGNTDSVIAPALAVRGRFVIVGYTKRVDGDSWVVLRRSVDSGKDWRSSLRLAARNGANTYDLVMAYRGRTLRAAYGRCITTCETSEVILRTSQFNGRSWSQSRRVSPTSHEELVHPVGVDGTGNTVVVWWGIGTDGSASVVRARRQL